MGSAPNARSGMLAPWPDRRGHAMPGMDAVYNHVTTEMRQRLCEVLEGLWQSAVDQRRDLDPRSTVKLLDRVLITGTMAGVAGRG